MKEFANDYFKFDKNGRKFSKWVENTMGKGEIAHFALTEQFFLLKDLYYRHVKNQGLIGKGLKSSTCI